MCPCFIYVYMSECAWIKLNWIELNWKLRRFPPVLPTSGPIPCVDWRHISGSWKFLYRFTTLPYSDWRGVFIQRHSGFILAHDSFNLILNAFKFTCQNIFIVSQSEVVFEGPQYINSFSSSVKLNLWQGIIYHYLITLNFRKFLFSIWLLQTSSREINRY